MAIAYRPGPGGARTMLNVTAATQVKVGQGIGFQVFVNTAPTAAGGIYDSANSAGAVAANLICAIPLAAGPISLAGTPFFNGLYIDPGTGGVVSLGYE